jgi:hypothetical protein
MFGLSWDFAVDLRETFARRVVSAGPSKKAGRLILDMVPKNSPQRRDSCVVFSNAVANPTRIANERALT